VKTFSKVYEPNACGVRRYTLHGPTMGTRYSAVFFAPAGIDEAAIGASLHASVNTVDRQMSNWKPDSDLSRLNRAPAHEWVSVPPALAAVLTTALQVGRVSHGAFDIGLGELVQAWGFGPGGSRVDEQRIRAFRAQPYRPAADVLDIDAARCRVRKSAPITLDLSGIAKGYGVDCLASCLDGFGMTDYLVSIDGELRSRGAKPGGQPWSVAIEKPLRGIRDVIGVMELGTAAIATSGDYRHWAQHEGRSYSHTMNGALREPASNRLAAVSVVASTCMLADAWATALLVLGEEAGIDLARERGMDAVFVLHEGDGFRQIVVAAEPGKAKALGKVPVNPGAYAA
jgi:thiamine biosynthesis lipoprotein